MRKLYLNILRILWIWVVAMATPAFAQDFILNDGVFDPLTCSSLYNLSLKFIDLSPGEFFSEIKSSATIVISKFALDLSLDTPIEETEY